MLTYNNGACQQNGSYGIVDVGPNQPVIYQGAAPLRNFQVQFAECPFASCPVDSPHGISINVWKPKAGAAGNTFSYTGITINSQPCTNASGMGVHIMPGE